MTVSYRLGVFGFLSLDSAEYSGNMGLKDIRLALKWFNKNAAKFGGDNQQITVAGHSAGGALSHFIALAPSTQQYFKRSISMSGTALNTWSMTKIASDDTLFKMFLLGKLLLAIRVCLY